MLKMFKVTTGKNWNDAPQKRAREQKGEDGGMDHEQLFTEDTHLNSQQGRGAPRHNREREHCADQRNRQQHTEEA
jgi:hypothetical protein